MTVRLRHTRSGRTWTGSEARAGLWLALLLWAASPVQAECAAPPTGLRTIINVIDGETLTLDDGSQIRLIGALAPRAPDPELTDRSWMPARVAAETLERWALGRAVDLRFDGRRTDRHGHLLAHVFLHRDGERIWLQGRMVEEGLARAYSLSDNRACIAELLERENDARTAARGLWSMPAYQVRIASRPREIERYRHTYQLVEGRVRTVTEPGGRTLISFGRGERTDFFAMIEKSDRRLFDKSGIDPQSLARRRVRVRGWVETWGGPFIKLTHPEQLEILSDASEQARVRRRPFTRAAFRDHATGL